jgi:hypothetical protein
MGNYLNTCCTNFKEGLNELNMEHNEPGHSLLTETDFAGDLTPLTTPRGQNKYEDIELSLPMNMTKLNPFIAGVKAAIEECGG